MTKKMGKIKAQGELLQAMADHIKQHRESKDFNPILYVAMLEQAARAAIFFGYKSFPGILSELSEV